MITPILRGRRRLAACALVCIAVVWLAAPGAARAEDPRLMAAYDAFVANDLLETRRILGGLAASGHDISHNLLTKMMSDGVLGEVGAKESAYLLQMAALLGQESAVAPLQARAGAGEAEAIYALAVLQEAGRFVPKDFDAAVANYVRAAKAGLPVAQSDVGSLYESGLGVPQDLNQARIWYERAAENGWADAHVNLGALYLNGKGVPTDAKRALEHFARAAGAGDAEGQYNLGLMLARGQAVPQNITEAMFWLAQAKMAGLESAETAFDLIMSNLTEDEREAVRRELDR